MILKVELKKDELECGFVLVFRFDFYPCANHFSCDVIAFEIVHLSRLDHMELLIPKVEPLLMSTVVVMKACGFDEEFEWT